LIALNSRLISTCLTRVRSAVTKRDLEARKVMPMPRLLRLRLDHGAAFDHHLGQRHRLVRQRDVPDSISEGPRISLISSSRYQPP
jgi:hypothetical protein